MIKNRVLASAGYGTHITPLVAAILHTSTEGNILELGLGDYSTPLLHEIVKYQRNSLGIDRHLFSYENNAAWLNNFIDLKQDWHQIHEIENWDEITYDPDHPLSVVFIDHAPAERRIIDIEKYKDIAKIIVVHDTDKPIYYGYTPVFDKFKYQFKYERYRKSTTLLSNFIDVTKILKQ